MSKNELNFEDINEVESRIVEGKEAYPIEKGIPIPEIKRKGRGPSGSKYPIEEMEIGESIRISDVKRATVDTMKNKYRKRLGYKFLVVPEAGAWRLHRVG